MDEVKKYLSRLKAVSFQPDFDAMLDGIISKSAKKDVLFFHKISFAFLAAIFFFFAVYFYYFQQTGFYTANDFIFERENYNGNKLISYIFEE